jgi:hypothetical protein
MSGGKIDIVMRRIDNALARLDAMTGALVNADDCASVDRISDNFAGDSRIDESRLKALEADNDRLRAAVAEALGQIEGLISRVGSGADAVGTSDRAAGSPSA